MDDIETTTDSGEFNLHEAADEILSNDSQDASTNDSQPDGQSQDSTQEGETKEVSAEDILKQVAEEKDDQGQFADILKGVNSLGMVRNGLPVNIETPEQLKELIQKGYDYTQKTMEHAEMVKTKDAEFQQKEAQYKEVESQLAQQEQQIQDTIFSNQIMGEIVQDLQENDPELFDYLDKRYRSIEKNYLAQQPIQKKFEGKISELEKKLNDFQGQKQSEELGKIKEGWEKELSEVQSTKAAPLAKLGVKVDWDKVKEAWVSDASGKMSVDQALYAAYGADIAKAYESHKSLLETRAKSQAKLINRTGIGGGQRGGEETIAASAHGDYSSILRQASATM